MEQLSNDLINRQKWIRFFQIITVMTLIFASLICVLLIANYVQIKLNPPLTNPALQELLTDLKQDPDNQKLRQQIRTLDLMARKAFFTSQWQIKVGGYLLFLNIVLMILALKTIQQLKLRIPDGTRLNTIFDQYAINQKARKAVSIAGIVLLSAALLAGFSAHYAISNLPVSDVAVNQQQQASIASFPSEVEIRQNWPGFRGPGGNAVADFHDVPTEWDGTAGKNILWKTPLEKPGFNSPIRWENRIFFAGADKTGFAIYCVDANSGEYLWQTAVKDIAGFPDHLPDVSKDTGFAAPTMTTDGRHVFAIFATGDLVGCDVNGKRLWAKNIGIPQNHYGHASSLIMHQNHLIVQYDTKLGGRLIAFSPETGKIVWDKKRDAAISWTSPICVNTGTRFEVIINASPFVIAHDPGTGSELWRFECMSGEVAPSPAYADGIVFVVNEYAKLAAIAIQNEPELLWEFDEDLSEISSPAATDSYLILPTSYGTVTCFNTKSGEKYWVQEFDTGFYSSPIIVGEMVYLIDLDGVCHIFKADKKFDLISSSPLGEECVTTPVFADRRVFIRGQDNLYCIGND